MQDRITYRTYSICSLAQMAQPSFQNMMRTEPQSSYFLPNSLMPNYNVSTREISSYMYSTQTATQALSSAPRGDNIPLFATNDAFLVPANQLPGPWFIAPPRMRFLVKKVMNYQNILDQSQVVRTNKRGARGRLGREICNVVDREVKLQLVFFK